jgi:sugar/nucleoside kinase (ribokinase family)
MRGLFAGLNTIDIQFITDRYPRVNTKTLVSRNTFYLGGPAANAAITFSNLGANAALITSVGNHLLRDFVLGELQKNSVKLFDISHGINTRAIISTVVTSGVKGDRTVLTVSPEIYREKEDKTENLIGRLCREELSQYDILQLDCFYMRYAVRIAREAKKRKIPVVIDGGSWKNDMEELLEFVNIAICSSDFYPPGTKTRKDVFEYLDSKKINRIAITRGDNPIIFKEKNQYGKIGIDKVEAIDTLGAGDIFHGAFCYYYLKENNFAEALQKASVVATESCKYQGTRAWIQEFKSRYRKDD